MAIDFMVMPMSRYISGDFVTLAMRLAWSNGVPYAVIGPNGRRELPPGLPFGGPDASVRRNQIVEMVLDDLRALPCPPEAASAADTLREALTDSLRLRLPIIVDW